MGFVSSLRISASALTAERLNMDVISNNIANVQTTGPDGPYQRQRVVFRSANEQTQFGSVLGTQMQSFGSTDVIGSGVRVVRVEEDPTPGQRVYEPNHADADADGYVTYPNVNITSELVNLLAATKAYQANVTVVNATKTMALKAISIGSR
ncbi:MAG: flagellar basal body rod protein FlgC [Anaerolineae bacterium]